MMGFPDRVRVWQTMKALPEALIAPLDEADLLRTVSARDDTVSLVVSDGDDKLLAHAVVGPDEDGMTTIYAARCLVKGPGTMFLRAIFGASEVLGRPLRVHTQRIDAFARAVGAETALEAVDGEGLPMGVFNGR